VVIRPNSTPSTFVSQPDYQTHVTGIKVISDPVTECVYDTVILYLFSIFPSVMLSLQLIRNNIFSSFVATHTSTRRRRNFRDRLTSNPLKIRLQNLSMKLPAASAF